MESVLAGWTGNRGIKTGIVSIKVFAVQILLHGAQSFPKALEMDNFPCTEKADGISDFRIFDQSLNVVIGKTGFLFRSHAFIQVCDRVSC